MSGKCKVESEQCRNCIAIITPPSDEVRVSGGDLCEAEAPTEPAGENQVAKSLILTEGEIVLLFTKSLPQSASQTAPSSEGAEEYPIKTPR